MPEIIYRAEFPNLVRIGHIGHIGQALKQIKLQTGNSYEPNQNKKSGIK
jgi:hypothetical protein